ncbi:oligoendopeptidase F [Weissella diestrammenae]|uniref:Oligopeptidase F n=1 Tax=Weissella diestrammenae TaxID=1162633 RepID=A0A7G9T4T1_9LACO|nr:oligoendopeptidase F [Weissella diestrammenae]MCM0582818.1 oligoendopeptidase F [Weissella diestrammenae]QNN75106.1 oligoendopeptidase F [Weissella diestrammenae]
MVKQIPTRDEVATEKTWDLSTIFPSDEAWFDAVDKIELATESSDEYAKKVTQSGQDLYDGLTYGLQLMRQLEKVYVYASMKADQDTTNTFYQGLNAQAGALAAKVSAAIAFFDPAIVALTDSEIKQLFADEPRLNDFKHYFKAILIQRGHVLSRESEELLAGASDIFNASQNTFSILDNADIEFGTVENDEGEIEKLTNGVYSRLLESVDPVVRKNTFTTFYEAYIKLQNTYGTLISSHVKQQNYLARVHHYSSAREAALAQNFVPEKVYDTLVEETHRALPLLHRYVALRKKLLGLSELHSYDLYTPILGTPDYQIDYETAKAEALEALAPLGKDYLDVVNQAYDNRWIDVVENKGKRSGAYSGGSYDTKPFILLNWVDNLNNLHTLVHEMGHSVHSYETRQNQPYHYGDYPIFLAEIASTTNENLLTDYLLNKIEDKALRAYVLNQFLDGMKGTMFRQTQFAEFEQWMHEEDAAGTPLTADVLNQAYAELNQTYYGPALTVDTEIAHEWERIPHFYYDFYVFQYATGFAAATAFSEQILHDGPEGVAAYKGFLKAGSSDFPVDIVKQAGVDMTKPDYLRETYRIFEERLNEFEQLVDDLA